MRKLAPQGKAPILCFVGPPGVGKTSLGQSIARAMDRKFVRVSLGGVHDEAEIRGHRRTYIGALPGNIIQAIRKAGTRNCVMMLDEIDKLGAGIQGDPGAALLEVLDPEQNNTFRDNYLGVPFDLSRVVFITTANVLDTIPGPLRDRMEIIGLVGLHRGREAEIARRYLVRAAAGGERPAAGAGRDRRRGAARHHPALHARGRRAQPRARDRQGAAPRRRAHRRRPERARSASTRDDLAAILGAPQFENEVAMRTSVPGVATGLAWTPVGGDILFIEATRIAGQRQADPDRPARRGDAGERAGRAQHRQEPRGVARHRRRAASRRATSTSTCRRAPSRRTARAPASPCSWRSSRCMTERTVRSDTAMTGEISLRGLVLPVGGIKEKVVAAARAGIKRVHAAGAQPQGLRRHPRRGAQTARIRLARTRRRGGRSRARSGFV